MGKIHGSGDNGNASVVVVGVIIRGRTTAIDGRSWGVVIGDGKHSGEWRIMWRDAARLVF